MHKLETQLAHFRFNLNYQYGPYNVTWYVLVAGNNADEISRCFTQNELTQFQNFVTSLPLNFPGGKNYSNCTDEEGPYCGGMGGIIPKQSVQFPNNVVMRKESNLNSLGYIYSCMDIILLDINDKDNLVYNLDFDVIGKINSSITN